MKKWLKVLLIVLCCFVVLVTAAGALVGNYFFNMALNPNGDRSAVFGADHNQIDSGGTTSGGSETSIWNGDEWLNETSYTDIYMESYDGLAMHAIVIRQKSSAARWVVAVHGYTSNGRHMSWAAQWFYDQGYNVLLPDLRGCGESGGDYYAMGWHDRLDLVDWTERLVADYAAQKIVLYGISMGGAAVLMTSGEQLPSQVKAVIEDCGYTSAYEEFAYQLGGIFGLPEFPVMQCADIVTRLRAGYWLGEASALEQVNNSITPTLFIHGDNDTFVPSDMVYELYEAASCKKQLYIVEGAGHGMASAVAGDAYWQTVMQFLAQCGA